MLVADTCDVTDNSVRLMSEELSVAASTNHTKAYQAEARAVDQVKKKFKGNSGMDFSGWGFYMSILTP